ncbi:hypothetical protein SAMN05421823_108203 [Catalinimonas alkaloidigena]|uniref:Uncharacterized protein n=1 Tax=Catalinimonas alkaloidigena TaxID=1075417 RepID=A0A1G9N8E4_9BACT|nr:hypothetical protein SAMN05421823_108203 [Catalinimonas alkaloidigena]
MVALLLGFLLFRRWQQSRTPLDPWTLLSAETALVIETPDLWRSWHTVAQQSPWQALDSLPLVQVMSAHLNPLDSLFQEGPQRERPKIPLLTSVHARGMRVAALFWLDVRSSGLSREIDRLLREISRNPAIQTHRRTLQGYTIHELSADSTTFSYLRYHNVLVGSFSADLVEEVINQIRNRNNEGPTFLRLNPQIRQGAHWELDAANLYLNTDRSARWLDVLARPETAAAWRALAQSASFDVSVGAEQILMNGQFTSDSAAHFIDLWQGQEPQPLTLLDMVPNRTALLYHWGISDAQAFGDSLWRYRQKHGSRPDSTWQQLRQKGVDLRNWFGWMGREVAFCQLESGGSEVPEQLLILAPSDLTEARRQLRALSDTLQSADEEPYVETYIGAEIRQLPVAQFPTVWLGNSFSGFDQTYYAVVKDVVVMANSVRTLKAWVFDIEAEEVWGRSVQQNVWREELPERANLSVMVNVRLAWKRLLAGASAEGRALLQQYAPVWRQFGFVAAQLSRTGTQMPATLLLRYTPGDATLETPGGRALASLYDVSAEASLTTAPLLVHDAQHRPQEVGMQDSSGALYLVSPRGQLIFRRALEQPLVSDLSQVQLTDKAPSYLFATSHQLWLLDRNGDAVKGFPWTVPDTLPIQYLRAIDYDGSRRYRILAATQGGAIYLYNTDGQLLDGWKPLATKAPLATAPFHVRVGTRDCFVVIQRNGTVHLLNRRGETYAGFPVTLGDSLYGASFWEPGVRLRDSYLTLLTDGGEVVRLSLEGKVERRTQLVRLSRNSRFQLCPTADGRAYVLARQDGNRLTLFNAALAERWEKTYLSASPKVVTYYSFGPDQQVIAVTDTTLGSTWLYNGQGVSLLEEPLRTPHPIALTYGADEKKYRLYRTVGTQLQVATFDQ